MSDRTDRSPDSGESSLFGGVAKHSVIYGIGIVISRAVSFLMLPIYTRYLTPADYGVMALVEMTLDFIAIIGGAKLALGVFRFYHKTDEEEAKRQVVSTSFFMVGALYATVGFVTFMAAVPLSHLIFGSDVHSVLIQVGAANVAVGALVIVPLAFARVQNLSTLYVGANVAKLILAVALNILFLVILGMGVLGIFIGTLIANALVGGFLAVWLLRSTGFSVSTVWTRNLLRYGIPLMATQVATFIATFSDRYFLQAAADETAVGLYSLAYQFGFLLMMVGFSPMDMVWGPKRFEIARREDRDRLLAKGFILLNVLLLSTAVGIVLFVEDVLRIMAAPAFHAAAAVVPVILVAYVFYAWSSLQDLGVLIRERTEYITFANFASAGVAVVGFAVLVPRYLEWGAAVATVLAFFTRYILTYAFAQRMWRVRYRWAPVRTLVIWSCLICAVALAMPTVHIAVSVTLRTGLLVVYAVGLWLLPVLDADDRETARRIARGALARLRKA